MERLKASADKTVDILWDLLHSVRQQAHPAKKGEVTMQQFILLKSLHRFGQQRVGELARMVGLTQSSVSIAIKRLEKEGLVVRERDSADERRVGLDLTEAGRSVARKWKEKRNQATTRFLLRLSEDEREELQILLQKMLDRDNRPGEEGN